MNQKNQPGNEPAFSRTGDQAQRAVGLTKNEYARIAIITGLLAYGMGETKAMIVSENVADQMFPTK